MSPSQPSRRLRFLAVVAVVVAAAYVAQRD
jgi:hypothetical protein